MSTIRLLDPCKRRSRSIRQAAAILIDGQSDAAVHGDVWQLTCCGWRQIAASLPVPARQSHAAAFDTRRKRIVVFGGALRGQDLANDLWEWNGQRWEERRRH